jgi:hypothetical protein
MREIIAKKSTEHIKPSPEQVNAWIMADIFKRGIITSQDKRNVVDLVKLKQYGSKNTPVYANVLGQQISIAKSRVVDALKNIDVVVNTDDGEINSEVVDNTNESKKLFVVPESKAEIFSGAQVNGYLKPWEIYADNFTNWDLEYTAKNGEKIDIFAWAIADKLASVFQIKRNELGQATILNPNTGKRQPFSWEVCLKNGLGLGQAGSSGGSIHRLLEEHPDLVKYGVLRESDFKLSGESAYKYTRKVDDFSKKNTSYFSAKGARYYIGRRNFIFNDGENQEKINKENLECVELDANTVGILRNANGQKDLKYTFPYLNETELQEKQVSLIKRRPELAQNKTALIGNTVVGQEEMKKNLRPWHITSDNPQWVAESATDYAERIKKISTYEQIDKIGRKIDAECSLNMHNLTWREQQWLATFHHQFETRGEITDLYNFGKQYKLEGLKTFLNCEYDLALGSKILEIGQKLPEKDAKFVFSQINELVTVAEENANNLSQLFKSNLTPISVAQLKLQLFKKSADMIGSFADKASGKKVDYPALDQLIANLKNSKAEIALLSAIIKAKKQEDEEKKRRGEQIEEFDFNILRDLSLDIKDFGEALSIDDAQSLESIANLNWQGKTMAKPAIDSLKGGLEDDCSNRFYILKFKGEVVAFVRYQQDDNRPGRLYAGSRNVDPGLRGLSVANHLIKQVHFKEAENNIIEAKMEFNNKDAMAQVEQFGFVIVGVGSEKDALFLEIECDMQKNHLDQYRLEGLPNNDLLSESALAQRAEPFAKQLGLFGSEKVIICSVDFNDATQKNKLARLCAEQVTSQPGKYRIVRYFKKPQTEDTRVLVFESNDRERL